jgi:hypothetical protein
MSYKQFCAKFKVSSPEYILTDVFPQNVVDDVSGIQHDIDIFYILYIIPSSILIFWAIRLKLCSVYVKRQRYVQVTIYVIYLGWNFNQICDSKAATSIDVNYMQCENIHITFVNEINKRIVIIVRPKSSL